MNRDIKSYVSYYVKSNRRLILLIFLILFVVIPFMIIVQKADRPMQSVTSFYRDSHSLFTMAVPLSSIAGLILAFIMPIYQTKFMYNRRNCDLFFSIPIKRSHLFDIQYILGLSVTIIPFLINAILASIIIWIKEPISISRIMSFFIVLGLCMIILYTLIAFISQKCNNLLDAIFVSGSYIILPAIFIFAVVQFFRNQSLLLFVSTTADNFFGTEIIGQILSLPYLLIEYINYLLVDPANPYTGINGTPFHWSFLVYWVIIAIICYYFARRSFIARKEENAEQRTTSMFTFPFIISCLTISLVLTQVADTKNIILPLVFTFVLYIVIIFFSQRKIKLNLKMIAFYVIICGGVFAFSVIFRQTNGFGRVQEMPVLNQIKSSNILVGFNQEKEVTLPDDSEPKKLKIQAFEAESVHYESNKDDGSIKKSENIARIHKLQKFLIDNGDKKASNEYADNTIFISYKLTNGKTIERNYILDKDQDVKECVKLLNSLMKNGTYEIPNDKRYGEANYIRYTDR